jgi:hypothetical protein
MPKLEKCPRCAQRTGNPCLNCDLSETVVHCEMCGGEVPADKYVFRPGDHILCEGKSCPWNDLDEYYADRWDGDFDEEDYEA